MWSEILRRTRGWRRMEILDSDGFVEIRGFEVGSSTDILTVRGGHEQGCVTS
jgi:hypothetical protein